MQYSTDNVTFYDVEKVRNPRFSGSIDQAEDTSNDSGGSKSHVSTLEDATLAFDIVADQNATGQEAIWAAYAAKTPLYWRLRPRGHNSGDLQTSFLGNISSIEESLEIGDVARYSVTVQKSGAPTRNAQS